MDVRFVASDLRRFDGLRVEAIALPLFSEERPLRGTAGLLDWRLCGQLAQAVQKGRVTGEGTEQVLLSARPRLPFDKVFIYGLGDIEAFDEGVFAKGVRRLLTLLEAARVRSSLCVLPGREKQLIGPKRAMELFLEAVEEGDPAYHDEITLVEGPEAQKEMTPVVEQARRRARARSLD